MQEWTLTRVRPTSGSEFVKSRHFPDSAQGNFLYNNVIGFLGIKQYKTVEDGSGFVGIEVEPLLQSTDPNFRPVAMQFGPDGALYVIDWFNPLIGHMQYSLRDPRRDKSRGRVWRITAKGRPLLTPPKIHGATIAQQLDLLKAYEDRTRYQARLALREWPTAQVIPAVEHWIAGLDRSRPEVRASPARGAVGARAQRPREPAAAETAARGQGVPRPRRGGARAAALVRSRRRRDGAAGAGRSRTRRRASGSKRSAPSASCRPPKRRAALQVLAQPMDYYLQYVLDSTMSTLEPVWKPVLTTGGPFATTTRPGSPSCSTASRQPISRRQAQHARLRALLSRQGVAPAAARSARRARGAERHLAAARDHRRRRPHGRHAGQRGGVRPT